MEKCKFCQEELTEGSTVCPHCGKDNAPETETVTPAEEVTEVTAAPEETAAEQTGTETPVEEEAADTAEQPVSTEEVPVETPEAPKTAPWKIVAAVAAVVVLIAALAALVIGGVKGGKTPAETTEPTVAAETAATETQVPATVPADGNPDDVTCKGTYTVTDEEAAAAKDTVVATMGDEQLTNGKLQVYYWNVVQSILSSNYGYSLMYQGLLDYSQPLDTQLCSEDSSLTWQQFFLGEALNYWQMYQSLALEAKNAGMEMPAEDREYLDGLEASLEETAANYGLSGIEELLLKNVGPGAGLEEFAGFQELYYQGKPYYTAETEKLVPTPEDLEAYYTENESYFTGNGVTKDGTYVNVRHILVMPEGGTTGDDGTTTYSDEEWAACEKKAQEILDEWLAGDATEDSFAALANEKSDDGDGTTGGLYENVYPGQMVSSFNDWCFDESRQAGNTGIIESQYGYHVMYFVGKSDTTYRDYQIETELRNTDTQEWYDATVEAMPMTDGDTRYIRKDLVISAS